MVRQGWEVRLRVFEDCGGSGNLYIPVQHGKQCRANVNQSLHRPRGEIMAGECGLRVQSVQLVQLVWPDTLDP
jgi:hypothetical protein